jgi:hypothetical protein
MDWRNLGTVKKIQLINYLHSRLNTNKIPRPDLVNRASRQSHTCLKINKKMKRTLFSFLLAATLILTACNGNSSKTNVLVDSTSVDSTTVQDTVNHVVDTASADTNVIN